MKYRAGDSGGIGHEMDPDCRHKYADSLKVLQRPACSALLTTRSLD